MHHSDEQCGCGHSHDHEHNDAHGEGCGCGHDHHHHDHGEGCGCGHHHHAHGEDCDCGHDHIEVLPIEGLSYMQQDFLLALFQRKALPVAAFSMTSAAQPEAYALALAPVYISAVHDGMEQVKQIGDELQQLENGGLISLDYDLPLDGYGYAEYKDSALYAYFVQTVAEGKTAPGALFDTAVLELGSMVLTEAGVMVVEEMIG